MIYDKKALSGVVATSLLLVLTVLAVVSFNSWFSTFQSKTLVNTEEDLRISENLEFELISDTLYINSEKEVTMSKILINSRDCRLNPYLNEGVNSIDVGSCISGLDESKLEVTAITDGNVQSNYFYSKDTSQKMFSNIYEIPGTDGILTSFYELSDGNLFFFGNENGADGTTDIFLIKANSNGEIIWSKIYNYTENLITYSFIELSNRNFLISGAYGNVLPDIFSLEIDSDGNELWNDTYGEALALEMGLTAIEAPNNDLIIYGVKNFTMNLYLQKLDSNGNEILNRTYPNMGVLPLHLHYYDDESFFFNIASQFDPNIFFGKSSFNDTALTVFSFNSGLTKSPGAKSITLSDGNLAFISTNNFTGLNKDIFLLKFDSDGNEIWNKSFDFGGDEKGYDLLESSDGSLILSGFLNDTVEHDDDIWIMKVDSNGNEIWNKTYDDFYNNEFGVIHVKEFADGGLGIMTRVKIPSQRYWFIRTDENGETCDFSQNNVCD